MSDGMPPIQQTMKPNGELAGARMPPTLLSLFCCAPFAISGYETGDLTDGSMSGSALIPFILFFVCANPIVSGIYAMITWKPDPVNIEGDGTMRTINNRFFAFCLFPGGPFAIAFWQNGDICTDCNKGDPGQAIMWNIMGCCIWQFGNIWACCTWSPKPSMFRRWPSMHGSRPPQPGEVAPTMMMMPVAVAQVRAVELVAAVQPMPLLQAV